MKKTVNRGAKKTGSKRKKGKAGLGKFLSLLKWSFSICLIVVLGLGVTFSAAKVEWSQYWNKVKMVANRPISNIVVQGEFSFIDKDAIQKLVEININGNFVDMNLARIKQEIEAMPWVESAAINRVWPDSMFILVVEQKPIARWGDSGFINQFGEIITTETAADLGSLPVLQGDESFSQEITETYVDIAEMLSGRGVLLRGIKVDAKRSWTLSLNDGLSVVLGREDILGKLRNFLYVYEARLARLENEIKKVDMRYEAGLAVEWKQSESQLVQAAQINNINKVN